MTTTLEITPSDKTLTVVNNGKTLDLTLSNKTLTISKAGAAGAAGAPGAAVSISKTLTTTDATAQNLELTTAITDGKNYLVKVEIIGRNTGDTGGTAGDIWAYSLRGAVKYTGGTVSMIASGDNEALAESAQVPVADFPRVLADDTAKAIDVRVTGQAGETIDWLISAVCYEV